MRTTQLFKANYFDSETFEEFWVSGAKRNGADGLYGLAQPRLMTMSAKSTGARYEGNQNERTSDLLANVPQVHPRIPPS